MLPVFITNLCSLNIKSFSNLKTSASIFKDYPKGSRKMCNIGARQYKCLSISKS